MALIFNQNTQTTHRKCARFELTLEQNSEKKEKNILHYHFHQLNECWELSVIVDNWNVMNSFGKCSAALWPVHLN